MPSSLFPSSSPFLPSLLSPLRWAFSFQLWKLLPGFPSSQADTLTTDCSLTPPTLLTSNRDLFCRRRRRRRKKGEDANIFVCSINIHRLAGLIFIQQLVYDSSQWKISKFTVSAQFPSSNQYTVEYNTFNL